MDYKLTPLEPQKNVLKRVRNKFLRDFIQSPKRSKLRKALILALPDYSALSGNAFSIHSLLCHTDVEMGICTYKVFNYVAGENFHFIIHDDGTLTNHDIAYIQKHIRARIYTRKESDLITQNSLQSFPNILKYRQTHFLALKLIDVKLFSSGERIAYLDPDILFFNRPDFYIQTFISQRKSHNFFNKDLESAYIDTPENIIKHLGTLPYPDVNAGLWVFNSDDISLEKIEIWLSHDFMQSHMSSYRMEQTLVSLLVDSNIGTAEYLPKGYDVDLFKLPKNSIGKHYVGKIRHGYEFEGIQHFLKSLSKPLV